MSPTAARNVAATITLTPGTVISRLTCGELERVAGDLPLDLCDLLVEELDLAQTAVDGLALLDRQLDLAQPLAAGQAEQVADRRLLDQPPHQHGVALVLRARARPHQLAAPRQPPAQRPRLLVGHPQPVQRPRGQQLRQRPGVEPVGLRARLPDPRVARMHDQHLADVRLEDPRDLPRVAGHLEHHPIARAPGSARTARASPASSRSGPPNGPRPPRRSRPRRNRGGRPTQCSSPVPPSSPSTEGEPVGKRHRRIRAHSTPGPVAGAATEKSGSKPIAQETACPTCVPQRSPCPGQPNLRPSPDSNPHERQFHAPKGAPPLDRPNRLRGRDGAPLDTPASARGKAEWCTRWGSGTRDAKGRRRGARRVRRPTVVAHPRFHPASTAPFRTCLSAGAAADIPLPKPPPENAPGRTRTCDPLLRRREHLLRCTAVCRSSRSRSDLTHAAAALCCGLPLPPRFHVDPPAFTQSGMNRGLLRSARETRANW